MRTLYISRVRARGTYLCAHCEEAIPRGYVYWRHDPHPGARRRGEVTAHYCLSCIPDLHEGVEGKIRIKAPAVALLRSQSAASVVRPVAIQLYEASEDFHNAFREEPSLIHELSSSEFEAFICDRLYAMGLEPRRIGATNQPDGGIDIVFWPREPSRFPYLGAVQVKHQSNPSASEGPDVVREFAGAIRPHPFQVGVLVTNTSFTPSAEWYAGRAKGLLRLRDFNDIRRWLMDSFDSEEEWREIPRSIELCPGTSVTIDSRNRFNPRQSRT